MIIKVCVLLSVICASFAIPPGGHYGPPKWEKKVPIPYSFSYGVKDPYAGTNFGQNEQSDGKAVHGSYTVQLPDGRKQTVTYKADHYNGFVADVSYYGEAKYPSKSKYPPFIAKPQEYHPEPPHYGPPKITYHEPPVYKPTYH